jgi:hypothetical protein
MDRLAALLRLGFLECDGREAARLGTEPGARSRTPFSQQSSVAKWHHAASSGLSASGPNSAANSASNAASSASPPASSPVLAGSWTGAGVAVGVGVAVGTGVGVGVAVGAGFGAVGAVPSSAAAGIANTVRSATAASDARRNGLWKGN